MKVREVPQDPGHALGGHQKLTYAVGEDGRYTGVPTVGWEVEIAATAVSTNVAATRIRGAWEAARAGRTSPLGYHMAAAQMDVALLATEARKWGWQVRRLLRPDVFAAAKDAALAPYADAMAMTVAALRALPDAPDLP